ncbi:TetR family transcriptional regulator [Streptomyces avicenniae]|uniref:TetR family transcriptional regulator n=1 Tax=Streptomyces avicenniae TaxID=500153 RepID=UPI00069BBFD6|nr:TetR family transcriptional regulator [Streptomyces avicenniae]
MAHSADETRRKILAAATEEFAAHGIAGARVDRITTAAGVNNALLYRYFGNKAQLFDTVYGRLVTEIVTAVPLDATDLPGYAARLFDYYERRPEVVRLAIWRQLERPDQDLPDVVHEAQRHKAAAIAEAQRAGTVADRLPPEEVRDLLSLLSLSGAPHIAPPGTAADRDRRRASVVAATEALTRP